MLGKWIEHVLAGYTVGVALGHVLGRVNERKMDHGASTYRRGVRGEGPARDARRRGFGEPAGKVWFPSRRGADAAAGLDEDAVGDLPDGEAPVRGDCAFACEGPPSCGEPCGSACPEGSPPVDVRVRNGEQKARWNPGPRGFVIGGAPTRTFHADAPKPFARRQVGFTSDLRLRGDDERERET